MVSPINHTLPDTASSHLTMKDMGTVVAKLCATTTTLRATGNLPSKGKPSHREQCQS
jgi:hypothetical protein